jgi:hypothetical protein
VTDWGGVDFEALLSEARRTRRCAECGADLHHVLVPRSAFCSEKHRYAFRDRRRYLENAEGERERSRRYYAENREAVLGRAAAKRQERSPRRCACGAETWSAKSPYCRRCSDAADLRRRTRGRRGAS